MWAALTLAGHSGTVRCLHLHNNRLVSGSSDRTLKVLNTGGIIAWYMLGWSIHRFKFSLGTYLDGMKFQS